MGTDLLSHLRKRVIVLDRHRLLEPVVGTNEAAVCVDRDFDGGVEIDAVRGADAVLMREGIELQRGVAGIRYEVLPSSPPTR